ncbi:hypothetical protein A6V36_37795 [Paraburkholderia ginsengiterrae]|uniref:Uncharacterized protein n=1 Tax=Paraburkholderia ginsengiterrae TaxID=1462993 RepID=A0ABX2V1M2_9BURK|nr:hypothetical protein A6V36_37795 [Paraburkholderia ginsengiterrae]
MGAGTPGLMPVHQRDGGELDARACGSRGERQGISGGSRAGARQRVRAVAAGTAATWRRNPGRGGPPEISGGVEEIGAIVRAARVRGRCALTLGR